MLNAAAWTHQYRQATYGKNTNSGEVSSSGEVSKDDEESTSSAEVIIWKEPSVNKLPDQVVDVTSNQSSKAWYKVAIAVGSLFLLLGVFGALGLAHMHGLITLPQWMATAVGAIGQTPHFWSLWTVGVGGVVIGLGGIVFGIYKISKMSRPSSNTSHDAPNTLATSFKKFNGKNDLT